MNIVSSYDAQIKKANKHILNETIKIYREAISFLMDCFDKEWAQLCIIKESKTRFNYAEGLIHTTSKNKAKYGFDDSFVKFPSYMRRAAVQAALGAVSSYRSNLANWEKTDKKTKPPKLQCDCDYFPTFYRTVMYKDGDEKNTCQLKLYNQHDWVWITVHLRGTDIKYIDKYWSHCKKSCPTLEKKFGKFYLRFAFEEEVKLSDTPIAERRICAVDLGLNTDAVCSIMTADGTILARKFINFPSEKDQKQDVLNRIRRKQREHGPHSATSMWKYATRLNDEHAIKVAQAIVDFAVLYSVDVIVFEHLGFKGKKRGRKNAQTLSLWRRNSIQDYAEHKAHRCGIRTSHICAWGTSKLAFDGSGVLARDKNNHALATFASGKQYNCDLSASYNIGARYFVRELLKPLPVTDASNLLAKVPEAARRTQVTLSTLKSFYPEYEETVRQLEQRKLEKALAKEKAESEEKNSVFLNVVVA